MVDETWFAVRTLVANNEERPWGPHHLPPGQIDYEERITLWRAAGSDAAIAMAEEEAERYVEDLGGEVLGLTQAYALATKPAHGVEVFSLIRRSELTAEDYLGRHFDTGTEHQHRADE
ncbi:hypothetical protein [Phycicoccus sp.]|uniref:hypothetical protein n=1 Tax=Phycicoccus sp. TaxID=1902410 RepID=UPI002C7FEF05|nr:hypothetical protein [Phycicoccus sp.]HMM94843.1 hypothetical protein [Phycicoccus sp.]